MSEGAGLPKPTRTAAKPPQNHKLSIKVVINTFHSVGIKMYEQNLLNTN